jgi:hypothetical protein
MFRQLRILVLLLILATVALAAWRAERRLGAWEHSIHVAVYPVAGDDSPATRDFVRALEADSFAEIAEWLQAQTTRHGRPVLQPVVLRVAAPLSARPPLPPPHPSMLEAIRWSLELRWWAGRHDAIGGPKPDIRLFVLFHDPAQTPLLPHSTGLEKGRIGLIHAFASRQQSRQNAVVIAHELLHTFGASDKYDPATLQPLWPAGYGEPQRGPRLPQRYAEIMGGRIALAADRAEIPDSLGETVIGTVTAGEIGLTGKGDR